VRPVPFPVHPPSAISVGPELECIYPERFDEGSGDDGGAHVKIELLATVAESAVHGRCAGVLHCQDKVPSGGGGDECSEEEEDCCELHFIFWLGSGV